MRAGLPSIHTDYWDPVFRACEETGFVLSMHVGSSSNLIRTSPDMPTLAFMAYSAAANQAGTLLDWLFSGNFERFPGLKIALSEGSIGWIPYFLERADDEGCGRPRAVPGATSSSAPGPPGGAEGRYATWNPLMLPYRTADGRQTRKDRWHPPT